MVTRIGAEIRRPALTSQITSAITTAVESLEEQRFVFNETREFTFNTVADQEFYDGDDHALIPRLVKIDYIKLVLSSYPYNLRAETPEVIETLNRNATQTGEPVVYCYYGEQLRLGYVPSDAYTIRIGAVVTMPAPASDSEADNPWMVKAERATRCRAKFELYTHVLKDTAMADRFHPDNEEGPTHEAIRQLRRKANQLMQKNGYEVEATTW